MFQSQRIHHQGVITSTLAEITCNGSQIFITCVVGVWRRILNLWCVCTLRRAGKFITPWWWILCDPKHVGV